MYHTSPMGWNSWNTFGPDINKKLIMEIADKIVSEGYQGIFVSQVENIEGNAPGCYNDMDMLIVGMHGNGNVGIGGCTDEQYLQHFAMWAFLGSPLIIGADIRSIDEVNKATLLNKGLISIHQDPDCTLFECS